MLLLNRRMNRFDILRQRTSTTLIFAGNKHNSPFSVPYESRSAHAPCARWVPGCIWSRPQAESVVTHLCRHRGIWRAGRASCECELWDQGSGEGDEECGEGDGRGCCEGEETAGEARQARGLRFCLLSREIKERNA